MIGHGRAHAAVRILLIGALASSAGGCGLVLPRVPASETATPELTRRLEDAESLTRAGKFDESLPRLDAIVADAPTWFRARRARQDALLARSGKDAAIADARAAVERDRDAPAHTLLARVLDGDAAKAEIRRAIDLDPEFPWAHFASGANAARDGDLAGAELEFTAALKNFPRFPEALRARARVRDELADFEGACADYENYLDSEPADDAARYALASILHRELDRPDAAEEHYRLLLDQKPRFAPAAIGLAVRLTEQHDYDGAERLYRSVYSDPLAKFNLGLLYLDQLGRYAQAEQCFNDFLADDAAANDDTLIAERLLYAPLRLKEVEAKLEQDHARRSTAGAP